MPKPRLVVASPSHASPCTVASSRWERTGGAGQCEPGVRLKGGQQKLGRALLLGDTRALWLLLAALCCHFLILWDIGGQQATGNNPLSTLIF